MLLNVNPARLLAAGFDRVGAAVCFSATMAPQPYFQELLGLDQAGWYAVPSPFDSSTFVPSGE